MHHFFKGENGICGFFSCFFGYFFHVLPEVSLFSCQASMMRLKVPCKKEEKRSWVKRGVKLAALIYSCFWEKTQKSGGGKCDRVEKT